jgi:hypothetical protein
LCIIWLVLAMPGAVMYVMAIAFDGTDVGVLTIISFQPLPSVPGAWRPVLAYAYLSFFLDDPHAQILPDLSPSCLACHKE